MLRIRKYMLFLIVLVLFSCKKEDETKEFAKEYCDCVINSVNLNSLLDGSITDFESLIKESSQKGDSKLQEMTIKLKEMIFNKSGDNRVAFVRSFVNSFLETDCGYFLLTWFPYDEVLYIPENK